MSITYTNGSNNIKNGSGTAVCRAQLGWEKTAETSTSVTYSCRVYIYCIRYGYSTSGTLSASLDATGKDAYAVTGGSCSLDPEKRKQLISHSYTFTKTTSSQSKTISFSVTANGTSVSGKSSGTKSITVPALTSYSVSYDGNGATSGSMSAQTKYYGKSLTLRSNAFSRTGYNFSKFNTNASGTGTNYSSGGTYTANAKATLYAQWTPQTHTITYYGNGATSGSTYTQTKTYGQTATLYNNFTRDGYSITGWNTAADGSGTAYSTTQVLSTTFNSNLILYAQWKLNYTKATISNLIVQRVRTNDTTETDCRTEFDQGTILYVSFHYKTGSSDGTSWTDSLACNITIDGESVYSTAALNLNDNGEGNFENWFLNGTTGYTTEQSHTIVITLTNEDPSGTSQSVSKTITISPSTFPIDLLVGSNDDVYMGVMHPAQTGTPLITAPLKVDGNISIPNTKAYFANNNSGQSRYLCGINASNEYVYGWGSYDNDEGIAFYEGNSVHLRAKTTNGIYFDTGVNGFYKITTVPVETGTVAAGDYKGATTYSMTTQSGYNAVGIVGWSTGNWRIQPTSHYVSSNSALYAGFANYGGTSASTTITFRVLWLKATEG